LLCYRLLLTIESTCLQNNAWVLVVPVSYVYTFELNTTWVCAITDWQGMQASLKGKQLFFTVTCSSLVAERRFMNPELNTLGTLLPPGSHHSQTSRSLNKTVAARYVQLASHHAPDARVTMIGSRAWASISSSFSRPALVIGSASAHTTARS